MGSVLVLVVFGISYCYGFRHYEMRQCLTSAGTDRLLPVEFVCSTLHNSYTSSVTVFTSHNGSHH